MSAGGRRLAVYSSPRLLMTQTSFAVGAWLQFLDELFNGKRQLPGGHAGAKGVGGKAVELAGVESGRQVVLDVSVGRREGLKSKFESQGDRFEPGASHDVFERKAILSLIVLQRHLLAKHGQAMLAPAGVRMLRALAGHVDEAVPQPLRNDGDPCSCFIAKRQRDRILPKFMEPQHGLKMSVVLMTGGGDAVGALVAAAT